LDFRSLILSVELCEARADDLRSLLMRFTFLWPNKAPEPTPRVAPGCATSAQSCRVTGAGWLSFFR